MKISIDVDLTPEELRRLFGLPDLTPVQEMMVQRLSGQIEKGLDGTLLPSFMRSVMEGGMQSFEAYQRLLANLLGGGTRGADSGARREAVDKTRADAAEKAPGADAGGDESG